MPTTTIARTSRSVEGAGASADPRLRPRRETGGIQRLALALGCVIGLSGTLGPIAARAADYGDFSATGFDWNGVADTNGLMGPFVSTGDQISPSSPALPQAESSGLIQNDAESDTLTFEVVADTGFSISGLRFTHAGEASVTTFLSDLAAVTASSGVFIDIFEVDGVPISTINVSLDMLYGEVGQPLGPGGFSLVTTAGVPVDLTANFVGELDVDFDAILAANTVNGSVTRAQVSFDTGVTSFAGSASFARIALTDFDIETLVVPEPTTGLMLGLGLGVLARSRRTAR